MREQSKLPAECAIMREQRWYEAPRLDHSRYELYEKVQKKAKVYAVWNTKLLDLDIEMRLLGDCRRSIAARREQADVTEQLRDNGPSKEAIFFRSLMADLEIDSQDVREELVDLFYDHDDRGVEGLLRTVSFIPQR